MFPTLFTDLLISSKNNMGKNAVLPQTDSVPCSPIPHLSPSNPGRSEKLKSLLNCSFQLLADFFFVINIFIDDST